MNKYLRKSLAALVVAAGTLLPIKSYSQSFKWDYKNFKPNSLKLMYWDYDSAANAGFKKLDNRLNNEKEIKNHTPDKYAVLMTGYDEDRFTNNLSSIYGVLLKSGFKKENIYVLDESGNEKDIYPSDGIATKKSLERLFSHLEKIIDEEDIFVNHIVGHGSIVPDETKPTGDSIFVRTGISILKMDSSGFHQMDFVERVPLYDSSLQVGTQGKNQRFYYDRMQPWIDSPTETDFKNYFSNINPKIAILTNNLCFGGGMVDLLSKTDKNYINISSSAGNELSWLIKDHSFTGYFYQAFITPEKSDSDKNGTVSVYEAFNYAKERINGLPPDQSAAIVWKNEVTNPGTPKMISVLDVKKISIK